MSSPVLSIPTPGKLDAVCPRSSHNCRRCYVSVSFVVFMIILCLVIDLCDSPSDVRCHVTEASLSTDSKFPTSITVGITIRNPNGFYHVRHEHMNFTAYYQNQTSEVLNGASFSQGRESETHLTPSFHGMQIIRGGNGSDSRENYYDVLVKLNMLDEYKRQLYPHRRHHSHLVYRCELKVPASSASSFNKTLCTYLEF